MKQLKEQFLNMHNLPREERIVLKNKLRSLRPDFLKPYTPHWWWWKRCKIKVLIVADGWLNFGSTGAFDLSEFLTAFNALESQTGNTYEVTLAHRGACTPSNNSVVVNHISGFTFDSSVNLDDFDQLWMFAFNTNGNISPTEVSAIESFMDNGGGVFATGDHGSIGKAMCGQIKRIKDMRYWDHFPNPQDSEVHMQGPRRNDTNQPETGSSISHYFDNQSDSTPQTIAARTFSAGMPHPLLSIKASLRPSRIIDIMPDHPHEGECQQETSFTVGSVTIPTQIIATSFVRGGSTTNGPINAGKTPTEPHCFPSIAVWDGWKANAGRIVVDSTWHHFVDINLDGSGSAGPQGTPNDIAGLQSGLTTADWYVVCQYYMNISLWMSRRKYWWCWRRRMIFELLHESQLIEASLDDPTQATGDILLGDIKSIGALAEEILSSRFNPAFARTFMMELLEEVNPELVRQLDIWDESDVKGRQTNRNKWINMDLLLYTAVGLGFLQLRDDETYGNPINVSEKSLVKIENSFLKGVEKGLKLALNELQSNVNQTMASLK